MSTTFKSNGRKYHLQFYSQLPFSNQRGTDIGTALNYTMREVFNTRADRPDAVNVIVVLTDGKTFWDGGKNQNNVFFEN